MDTTKMPSCSEMVKCDVGFSGQITLQMNYNYVREYMHEFYENNIEQGQLVTEEYILCG